MSEVQEKSQVIVNVQHDNSMAIGICALVFSILSLFFFAIVFVPLGLVCGVISIMKKQMALGVCSIIICGISFFLSPSLLGLFGLMTIRF